MTGSGIGLQPSMYRALPGLCGSSPFNEEITDIVRGARSVAVNVLGPRDKYERKSFLYKAKGPAKKIKFKAHKMLFLHFGRDEMDVDGVGFATRWIIGVASVLLGNLTAPMTGEDLSVRRVAVSELKRVDEELASLDKYRQFKRQNRVAKAAMEMLFYEQKIFQVLKRNAEIVLVLRILLLAFASVALMGAVVGSGNLLLSGVVGLFGITSVMLVKVGFDSSYYHVRREAEEMRRYVDYLLGVGWLTGRSNLYYPTPLDGA